MSSARIIVYDPATGEELGSEDMFARPILGDDGGKIMLALERDRLDDFEWGGVKFAIEVSPSAVRADPLTTEIVRLASELKVPVG